MQKTPLSLGMLGAVVALMILCEIFGFGISSIVLILLGGIIGIFAYSLPAMRKEAEK